VRSSASAQPPQPACIQLEVADPGDCHLGHGQANRPSKSDSSSESALTGSGSWTIRANTRAIGGRSTSITS
jgi:hypothetical protein